MFQEFAALGIALVLSCYGLASPVRVVSDAVNPFIGTEADGHCWPGATVPFALVQPSPDTGYQDWDYVAGYRHGDSRIRCICDRFYRNAPDGLCGNEDHGEMSAWYVFACLGFYPVNPCGGEFVLGAPQVPGVTLRLADGKRFTVTAKNFSRDSRSIKSVSLNGNWLTSGVLRYEDIVRGGELIFEMGAEE